MLNPPPALRPPLAANTCKPTSASQHNQAGTAFYKQSRLEEAKTEFLAAVTEGPKCAEAHYNLGLTLSYLGAKDEAREHFIQAANLAPGNQVIWDSPALRPYGDPQTEKKPSKTAEQNTPGVFGNKGGRGY
jgi:tetratricopeptide (TPR) repeat protein